MNWVAVMAGALQLLTLILQNKFSKDEAERKRKEALHADWASAIKSGDTARINDIINSLRT